MKIKTSELTGRALNWAVAKAEGLYFSYDRVLVLISTDERDWRSVTHELNMYNPSSDWSQGGQIIEKGLIDITPKWNNQGYKNPIGFWSWVAYELGPCTLDDNHEQFGSTPLIAAMRCYVMSKLGNKVDIPEEVK